MNLGAISRPTLLNGLARALAAVVGMSFFTIGTFYLAILLIGGLWEGFGRGSFTAWFFLMLLYVYGTAFLAFHVACRPGLVRGLLLTILVLPAVGSFVQVAGTGGELTAAVDTFADNQDPEAVAEAEALLLKHQRRAGNPPHVQQLLFHLQNADSDRQRIRLVRLLARLTHQHEPSLELLRRLREETRGDPERAELHETVEEAIKAIRPPAPASPEGGAADTAGAG
ncbi:hypothetical protein [Natronospira bacteriovora]|uniref:HEAT repeat protein n=1 Tax=Natronospira bacteriovora TaxID=3069753 RepID=A0ABU0W5J2_9GAMM|nr:hypothetical protein [Natronospira sp. AB-CW4]MDQ2069209.1 hypothetical protein [Natronospira sp. AB-CW4]